MMDLTDEEKAMHDGAMGPAQQCAIYHQINVGSFDAVDLVPVSQAHMMADPEIYGDAGIFMKIWSQLVPRSRS